MRNRVLFLLCLAELLAMSLWFTGTAVLPELLRKWHGDIGLGAWITIAVQIGFVVGALLIATLNLNDVFRAPTVLIVCSLAAAAVNAAFAVVADEHIMIALVLRALTGAFLAGVYPTGMKILAGWFREGRGLALGTMIGALSIGSALPHGVLAVMPQVGNAWREMVLAGSGFAVLGAVIVLFGVHEGPFAAPSPPFDPAQIGQALHNRRLRLANIGYLGHMWELYSMWGWIAVLLAAAGPDHSKTQIETAAFFAFAVGSIGCIWGGRMSDRLGRTDVESGAAAETQIAGRARVTIISLAISGSCCLLAAAVFDHFYLLLTVAMVWGMAIVADSAQFSTIISEVADRAYIGTALTMQTALGFLLTAFALRATSAIAAHWGWRVAAASMALGPALGIPAMARLARPAVPVREVVGAKARSS